MPGLGRYPCSSCHYIASNRRMLARHAALIHCDKVFKCPLCPFITRYAANWYRHKRDLHGLTKLTTCETCGFLASSTPELAQHREAEHPELLQLGKYEDKYAKEKIRLTEGSDNKQPDKKDTRNESDLLLDIYDIDQEIDINIPPADDEVKATNRQQYTTSPNGRLSADLEEADSYSVAELAASELTAGMNDTDSSPDNLRPLRIRRSYNCDQCGLLTNNPREYLYHLQSVHGEKISVHECKYCIYASKHIQKLTRHCNLVHRQQLAKDAEYKKVLESSKDKKNKPNMAPMGMPMSHSMNDGMKNSGTSNKLVKNKSQVGFFKCSLCTFQTRNKALMYHHEKKNHQKAKNFQCAECGYITNEKASYTKHIRYHSKPKLQCDHCFFKTAYKWNMDRHMKNHEVGAEGNFHCSECNFTTSTKQSYNAHVANHHDPSADATEDLELEEMNGGNDSNEWDDINVEDNESSFQGNDSNFDDYEFSESTENSNAVWKQGKASQRNLKCQQCDFRATWPFELKKHEENHKSQKKHHCPLCGMRFEHVAWLIKHLRRIHGDNPQAKSLAAAYDVMKPTRRRPGKEYAVDNMLPMFHDVLKQSNGMPGGNNNKNADSSKPSMLSSLLKKPLNSFAPPSVSKYSAIVKPKGYGMSSGVFKQPRISNYYQKASAQEISDSKKVPTCNICGYRTRWISELQRHMRVHSQEKPFQCHKCKYVCKWKGDLNRHLMKYHGIKMPSTKKDAPKFGFKKGVNPEEQMNEWSSSGSEKRSQFSASSSMRSGQESPLDLTLGRETFPHPNALSSPYDAYDFESQSGADGDLDDIDVTGLESSPPLMYSDYKSQIPQNNGFLDSLDNSPINPKTSGMKYQCPRCPFTTTTASRFHVHIVQHSNKRPFKCSVCDYNSNWEWDITKHIRLKKDKYHDKACVMLTDESGKRNYEKYEKYLVDANQQPLNHNQQTSGFQEETTEVNDMQDSVRFSTPMPNFNETSNKNCTYDFRNIGSNFEDSPINVVVTPDIPLFDPPDTQEAQENYLNSQSERLEMDVSLPNESPSSAGDAKYFHCKHCDFKHSTKRVVVSHLSSHTGLKPFRCRACGIVSNWRHVIVRHVKDVHNGYMNVVEERINFVQEGYYLRVISISGENENEEVATETSVEKSSDQFYGCKICPYKCDKEFYMNFHMKQHRPREGAVFKCDFCPYFVKFKKTLVRHMKLHNPPSAPSNETPNSNINNDVQPQQYENDVYDFYNNQNNEQLSNDDSIAISFNQLSQVEPAESSPQKIKRHVCEHCPYKTDNKTQYLYHKQFHRPNPSAPFKCNSCTYWASMQHLLTQHMRVHSDSDTEKNESPEKTDSPKQFFEFFDDKGVPEKISVVYVKKGEETVKMFKCEFCPMMNKKKANVRVHQKMHGVVINDGRYACCYCNYQCLNQGGLTNHMKVHQKNIDNELFNKYGDGSMSPKKFFDTLEDENSAARKRSSSYFCYQCPGIFKTANDLENHKKFHGCSLPLKCTYCDYRAKHKPHITQHLAVHTAEYKARRRASTPMNAESNLVLEEISENKEIEVVPPKKIDQMLLLEASELKAALRKTGEAAANLHKCVLCPASFAKMSVLVYHVSLHGSEGEFKCNQCDYAVVRADNLKIHSSVHPKKSPVKRPLKSFSCPKCPAVFYKQDRYERHLELHGKNYKFACTHCDYSVRFAANLIKHRKIHSVVKEPEPVDGSGAKENAYQNTQPAPTEYIPVPESEEKKITYICDRCPYYQMRKDAVQSHQRRHWLRDGHACPYCDYSSMQNCFLQNHIKLHMQPTNLFPPQAFVKFESFKIYMKDEDGDQLIFDDEEMVKNAPENPDYDKNSANDEIMNDVQETTSLSHNIEEDTSQSDSGIIRKLFPDIMTDSHTDSNLSGSSSRSSKVPIVVLSDIFANDDLKKWDRKLKIPKLKISRKYPRSSSSDRSHKKMKIADTPQEADAKKSKPSLVVKIKVENSRNNKHEKTTYSVSKSSDERLPKDSVESAENTNDSASEIVFQDRNSSLPIAPTVSPINDVEENTLTSNPGAEDGLKNAHSSAEGVVDSVVESTSGDQVLTQPSNENLDLKSEDSFSNDTVPAVSEILCDKLDCLTELSFKDSDLSLTNGDCSNPLTSNGLNLLPEEIKVGL